MDDLLLYLHLIFLAVAVMGVVVADRAAFGWVRGTTEVIGAKALFTAHWIVTTGLLGLVYTGLFLFWPLHAYLLTQPLFLLKMFFVGALLINGIAIDTLMGIASRQSYASLNSRQKTPLIISGAASGLGWVAVVVVAWLQFGWLF